MYITPHTHSYRYTHHHLLHYMQALYIRSATTPLSKCFVVLKLKPILSSLMHTKKPYFIFHNHVDYDIDRPRSVKAL